jgi:hypothetical protein
LFYFSVPIHNTYIMNKSTIPSIIIVNIPILKINDYNSIYIKKNPIFESVCELLNYKLEHEIISLQIANPLKVDLRQIKQKPDNFNNDNDIVEHNLDELVTQLRINTHVVTGDNIIEPKTVLLNCLYHKLYIEDSQIGNQIANQKDGLDTFLSYHLHTILTSFEKYKSCPDYSYSSITGEDETQKTFEQFKTSRDKQLYVAENLNNMPMFQLQSTDQIDDIQNNELQYIGQINEIQNNELRKMLKIPIVSTKIDDLPIENIIKPIQPFQQIESKNDERSSNTTFFNKCLKNPCDMYECACLRKSIDGCYNEINSKKDTIKDTITSLNDIVKIYNYHILYNTYTMKTHIMNLDDVSKSRLNNIDIAIDKLSEKKATYGDIFNEKNKQNMEKMCQINVNKFYGFVFIDKLSLLHKLTDNDIRCITQFCDNENYIEVVKSHIKKLNAMHKKIMITLQSNYTNFLQSNIYCDIFKTVIGFKFDMYNKDKNDKNDKKDKKNITENKIDSYNDELFGYFCEDETRMESIQIKEDDLFKNLTNNEIDCIERNKLFKEHIVNKWNQTDTDTDTDTDAKYKNDNAYFFRKMMKEKTHIRWFS